MRNRDGVNWRVRREFYNRTSRLVRHSKLALICIQMFPRQNFFSPEHWREKRLVLIHRRKQGPVLIYWREHGPILILRRKKRPIVVCNQARWGAPRSRSTHLTPLVFTLWFEKQTRLQILNHMIGSYLFKGSLWCWEAHHFGFCCLRTNFHAYFDTLII